MFVKLVYSPVMPMHWMAFSESGEKVRLNSKNLQTSRAF